MSFSRLSPNPVDADTSRADLVRRTSPELALATVRVVWQKSGSLWVPNVQVAPVLPTHALHISTEEAR